MINKTFKVKLSNYLRFSLINNYITCIFKLVFIVRLVSITRESMIRKTHYILALTHKHVNEMNLMYLYFLSRMIRTHVSFGDVQKNKETVFF